MDGYFLDLVRRLCERLRADEVLLANFQGEDSDFVRLNENRVRQAGSVTMRSITLDLVRGRRQASATHSLSETFADDLGRLERAVADLRERLDVLPDDPFLLIATEPVSSERREPNRLPDGGEAVATIQRLAAGRDLVGIYAAGGIHRGFANSLGQRNWYSNWSYNFDWSLYLSADRAVTANLAGFEWQAAELERKLEASARELALLALPAKTIRPGRYPVYLAPAAMNEVFGLLGWGGFGLRAHRTKTTPLLKMVEEGVALDRRVQVVENAREGIAPDFQEEGFRRPDETPLVVGGRYADCLASPRSAAEYGVATNGASASESPQSLDVAGGDVAVDDVCRRLGTGVWIGNLWYLNYSDRVACRTTGMTRFATFWVENGELVAPLDVMRFDETLYRMLGEKLVGLTQERAWILDCSTYGSRSTTSSRLPGAIVDDFTFTL